MLPGETPDNATSVPLLHHSPHIKEHHQANRSAPQGNNYFQLKVTAAAIKSLTFPFRFSAHLANFGLSRLFSMILFTYLY